MAAPEVPAWWRGALVAVALLQAPLVLGEAFPVLQGWHLESSAWTLLNAAIGGALAGSLLRRGGRDRAAAAGGIAAALLFALASEVPFLFLAGLGPSLAVAVTLARPQRIATPLAVAGLLASLVTLRLALLSRGPVESIPLWLRQLAFLSGAALLAGLLLHAARARPVPSAALSPGARVGLAVGGSLLLAASWLIGGNLLFLPIWPLALALLVLPPILAWRAAPLGAAVVAGIALAGLVPVGTCAYDPWSDAVVPGREGAADARAELVTLGEAGAHGPRWASGDGFGGYAVRCPTHVDALGAAWDVALVGAVAFAAVRGQGRRAPSVAATSE